MGVATKGEMVAPHDTPHRVGQHMAHGPRGGCARKCVDGHDHMVVVVAVDATNKQRHVVRGKQSVCVLAQQWHHTTHWWGHHQHTTTHRAGTFMSSRWHIKCQVCASPAPASPAVCGRGQGTPRTTTPPTQPPPSTKPSKASVPLVTTHTHTAQAQAPPADGHRLVIACVPHVCIDTVQSFCACCSLTTSMAQQQQRPPAPSVVCVPLAHLTIHHNTCHIRHPSCSGQHTRVVWVSMASHTVHTHAQTQTPHQTTPTNNLVVCGCEHL